MIRSIDPRPDVGVLPMMRHFNFEQSFALAEFVDNSIQSFDDNEAKIKSIDGEDAKLRVIIEFDSGNDTLTIEDNAGGINEENYQRAFTAGVRPPETSGFSEFGIGMKIAACWYSNNWTVETTALGENVKRIIQWDLTRIPDSIPVDESPIDPNEHFTKITLRNLHRRPHGRGYAPIREELASIYRMFIKTERLEISCLRERLSFSEEEILHAPSYRDIGGPSKLWKKPINFQLSTGIQVDGFAALRKVGIARGAGFSLFRRGRLIEDHYLHPYIFNQPNSGISQRLFGELHLKGVEVSFSKNGFTWNGDEENIFLNNLKEEVEELRSQAHNYRYRPSPQPRPEPQPQPRPEPQPQPRPEPQPQPRPEPQPQPRPEPQPQPRPEPQPQPRPEPQPQPRPEPQPQPRPEPQPQPEPEASVIEHVARVDFEGEVWEINLATPLIYFIELPEGGVIKIGITKSVPRLPARKSGAQTYFVDDVNFLGVIPFPIGDNPEPKEQELLGRFGRANTDRNECELVYDTPEVRMYIEENCKSAVPYVIAASRSLG